MKYAWIDAQTNRLALSQLCDTLEVSVSGYRAWKRGGTPDRKRLTSGQTLALIRAIHAEVKGAYGSPRMVLELRQRGYTASKARVERLMHLHGIRARHKRRYRVTTDSKHGFPVAPNLLDRDLSRRRRIRFGLLTSPTCGLTKAGSISPSCWTCSTGK